MRPRRFLIMLLWFVVPAQYVAAGEAATLKVASVQMQSSADLSDNVASIQRFLRQSAEQGARVVVFPECALTSYDADLIPRITPQQIAAGERQIATTCAELGIYAIVGSPHWHEGKLYNSATVFTPEGTVLERYHKLQLAERWPEAGDHLSVFPIDDVLCSIIICHDERYPELVRLPVLAGARVVFYISHESGLKHEQKIVPYRAQIQARAVENNVFVVHSNAPANEDLTGSHGHSRIIAPDGNLIGKEAAAFGEEILTATLELKQASASNALKSVRRGPLGDWWNEGLRRVRMIAAEDAIPLLEPSQARAASQHLASGGWDTAAVRDEIRPQFDVQPGGGRGGQPALVITTDDRSGLDGFWRKQFPIEGGSDYRLQLFRKTHGVSDPARTAFARIAWTDAAGKWVRQGERLVQDMYPPAHETDDQGWTRLEEFYRAPDKAVLAEVELRLRWAEPHATVAWSDISLAKTDPPAPRPVRLAAVHFRPRGGRSPQDNREMFVPFVEQAAHSKADLVVLGECLTYVGLGRSFAEVAEPVPGPSTEFFGQLAHQHDLYIVVPIVERDAALLYNTAALVGPDGTFIGKYRKICLPRGEWRDGLAAGDSYPVFETRFGKLGMMICWDLTYPQVARRLADNGAEVIAVPIWGGHPTLAAARAIENQVHLVTSTYSDDADWMQSGVWTPSGDLIDHAREPGVVVSEVDLNSRYYWPGQPDDFKSSRLLEQPPLVGR